MALLVERISGSRLLSDQKISQIVSEKALELSQEMYKDATEILGKTDIEVEVNPKVDIYSSASTKILLFDDGIQVKGQKNHLVKNQDKWQELIGYLEKHQAEIINYNRCSRAGKTIGSGQAEKKVDLTVGSRQKHRGMSLSSKGSRALCLLKVAELNGQWQQFWFPTQSA